MFIKKSLRAPAPVSLFRDDRGLTTVEYVILLVLVAVMSVLGWNHLGNKIKDRVDRSNQSIETNVPLPG
jgi:Flp pilus assembly pilin Flp